MHTDSRVLVLRQGVHRHQGTQIRATDPDRYHVRDCFARIAPPHACANAVGDTLALIKTSLDLGGYVRAVHDERFALWQSQGGV